MKMPELKIFAITLLSALSVGCTNPIETKTIIEISNNDQSLQAATNKAIVASIEIDSFIQRETKITTVKVEEDNVYTSYKNEDLLKEQCLNCWEVVNQIRLINANAISFEEAGHSEEAAFRFAIRAVDPNLYDAWIYAENNMYGSQIDKDTFKVWITTEERGTVYSLIKSHEI